VLPLVISDREFFPFKFWFNNSIQDGMYYRNELFYCLYSIEIKQRARLYHYACKLAQDHMVIISSTDVLCHIWISLRSEGAIAQGSGNLELSTLREFIEDGTE
jgi:hypothetical protein